MTAVPGTSGFFVAEDDSMTVVPGTSVISGNSTRWVAAVLLVIYLLVYVWLTFMYRKPSTEPKTRLIPFETYRAANQLNPFKIKRKIAF